MHGAAFSQLGFVHSSTASHIKIMVFRVASRLMTGLSALKDKDPVLFLFVSPVLISSLSP